MLPPPRSFQRYGPARLALDERTLDTKFSDLAIVAELSTASQVSLGKYGWRQAFFQFGLPTQQNLVGKSETEELEYWEVGSVDDMFAEFDRD